MSWPSRTFHREPNRRTSLRKGPLLPGKTVPFHRPSIGEAEIAEVVDTLRSGWLTTGPKVARFQQEFAAAVGARHAIALNSATAALHLALEGANSSEFAPGASHLVIDLLPEQRHLADKGGTMRLGLYPILLTEGSRASRLYGEGIIRERHRHRYEVNNDYVKTLEKNGLRVSGIWAEKQLVELIEIEEHPYFVAGQFHPEFRSRPWDPHPLFAGFVKAGLDYRAARA